MGDRNKRTRTQPPTLPTKLICKFLAWLEAKPLARSRCVTKTWNSLISELDFVKLHSSKAIENEQVLHNRQRVMTIDSDGGVETFDLDELFDQVDLDNPHQVQVVVSVLESDSMSDDLSDSDSVITTESTEYESEVNDLLDDDSESDSDEDDDGKHFCLPFYSNGLVSEYLSDFEEFKLYNPATKESKVVSKPPSRFLWRNSKHKLYGFGFDSSRIDYKIVCAEYYRYELCFSVYSLKTNCWMMLPRGYDYGPLDLQSHVEGVLVNGSIHWLIRTKDTASSMVLVSFHVADDLVQTIPLPPGFNSEDGDYYLTVFRGFLCVADKGSRDYWTRDEYGVRDSWTQRRMLVPSSQWRHLHGYQGKQS